MNCLLCFIVFTANILGSFNDPFEFEGDYGQEINPVRAYVFEQVVSKEALASNLTDAQIMQMMKNNSPTIEEIQQARQDLIAQAIQQDLQHGPTLNELIPPPLIELLIKKQQELKNNDFSSDDLRALLRFIKLYGSQKVFSFFRHSPSNLLKLDKILRDQASRQGKPFSLPILSSTQPLRGHNALELKENLLNALFTKEILENTIPNEKKLEHSLKKLDPDFLKSYLGEHANNDDLTVFTTPEGQVFFYWLYQSLNLHLIAQNEAMIPQINKVKQVFSETLGNPTARAQMFKDKLIAANASVVFTQESDAILPQQLTEKDLFHPINKQNALDGTFIFLRGDDWESNYQVIPIEDYIGYENGHLNIILATKKGTNEKFLLASGHGSSTHAEDGRLQITKIAEKFNQLSKLPENKHLQLIIGIDANTKSEEDINLLRQLLDSLCLEATNVGPTTIKQRMVTTQHPKAGRRAADEEDYIIILKPESGGLYQMTHPTVGFREKKPDPSVTLPDIDNPSDHYPVGVSLNRLE